MRSILPILVLGACSSAPEVDSEWARLTRDAATLTELPDVGGSALRAAMLETPDIYGTVVIRHAKQTANVLGGLPVCLGWNGRPKVGEPFAVTWSTRPTAAYPDGPQGIATYPAIPAAILVDTHLVSAPIPGWHGALLQVEPRWVFVPAPGSFLTEHDGIVELLITPERGWLGLTLLVQLLCADQRLAPAVEITFGNQ